jgi:hypothetical protein
MIPHISLSGLTRRRDSVSLLLQLNERDAQVLGHPAVAELLGLPDAGLVGGPRRPRTSPRRAYAFPSSWCGSRAVTGGFRALLNDDGLAALDVVL